MYLISIKSLEANFLALILFLLAGITDYLDGYIARKTNTESSLGALLDLLADKLLVCIVLVWLVYIYQNIYLTVPVLIIISRELIVSSLRQYMAELAGKNNTQVSFIGKSKTTLQFIAILFLIISPDFGFYFSSVAILMTWIAALISKSMERKCMKILKNNLKHSLKEIDNVSLFK
jgi:CDP-diacylglycerol--glycerol-3-phosphate 3-phosphatidyltransferase